MNELMEAARQYLKSGFHPIACLPREKRTWVEWKKYQTVAPTEKELSGWWGIRPDANVALVFGRGTFAVDMDGEGAESLLIEKGIRLPEDAPRSKTARGGHILLSSDRPIPDCVGLLRDGNGNHIDIRGVGYIVAPPSVHPSGAIYKWIIPPTGSLPKAPQALLDLITKTKSQPETKHESDGGWVAGALSGGAADGTRDHTCTRLAGYFIGRGVDAETTKTILCETFGRNSTPPFPAREISKCVDSIDRRHAQGIQPDAQYTRLDVLDGQAWADAVKDAPPREGIPAPIDTLEEVGGLVAGDLITLAGGPGMGKSTRAWNVLAEICIKQKVPTVVFTTEMTRYDVARWVACYLEEIPVNELPRRLPEHTLKQFRDSPIKMIDAGAVTLEDIETIVSDSPGVRLVIVDHLTRVSTKRRENRNLEVGQIARGLKSLAKDKHCTVLALCQINRAGNDNHQPRLSALRESGEIEQESDVVIFQWTDEEDLTKRFLKLAVYLAKNRHGAVKQRIVTWDKVYKRFTPYTNSGNEKDWEDITDGAN